MNTVFLNGRFLAQPATGVQRYAAEVVSAIDGLLAERGSQSVYELLLPPDAKKIPAYQAIRARRVGRLTGVPWEQFDLPRAARSGALVNLTSTGPILHGRQLVTVHDAGVFRNARNFSTSFALWYRFLIPLLGRRAHRVLTVSEFSRRELSRYAGIPEHKLVVTSNAADHIVRAPADADILSRNALAPGKYLLFVGSDTPNKNVKLLLEAIELLPDLDIPVAYAGERNPAVFAKQHGAENARVRSLGRVTDAELRALYEHAFCLVFPSLYEGFGIPPLEAMMCGCPVIASNSSALPDTCGDAALYCDPDDPAELARHIRLLGRSRDERQRLLENGTRRARRFSWKHCAEKVIAQVDQLTEAFATD